MGLTMEHRCMREKLIELQGEIDESTLKNGHIDTLSEKWIDSAGRSNNCKKYKAMNWCYDRGIEVIIKIKKKIKVFWKVRYMPSVAYFLFGRVAALFS